MPAVRVMASTRNSRLYGRGEKFVKGWSLMVASAAFCEPCEPAKIVPMKKSG